MRTLQTVVTRRGPVTTIHDAAPADVGAYPISPGLCAIIRHPEVQRTCLRRPAADPEARLTLAVANSRIVGRAVVAPSFGRWQTLPAARECGSEVAREWRRTGVATALTQTVLTDPAVEGEILLAFTLPSAWDAEYEGQPPAEYGRLLARAAGGYRFRPTGTDEPEVWFQSHAALLVRIGVRVPADAVAAFEQARYERRAAGGAGAQTRPSRCPPADAAEWPARLLRRAICRTLSLLRITDTTPREGATVPPPLVEPARLRDARTTAPVELNTPLRGI